MKYGKYKWKLIYAPKSSTRFTGSVSTKLTLVQDFFQRRPVPNFMKKRQTM